MVWLFLIPTGRINRKTFWLAYLAVWLLFGLTMWFLEIVVGVTAVVTFLLFLLLVWSGLALMAKRVHDADIPSGWLFLIFLPFIGWLILLGMACVPGTDAVNQHGQPPGRGIQMARVRYSSQLHSSQSANRGD